MRAYLFIVAGRHASKSAPITLKQWGDRCVFCMDLKLRIGVHVVIFNEHLVIREIKENGEYVADFLVNSPYRRSVQIGHLVDCGA